jgi:hypothetical protein
MTHRINALFGAVATASAQRIGNVGVGFAEAEIGTNVMTSAPPGREA